MGWKTGMWIEISFKKDTVEIGYIAFEKYKNGIRLSQNAKIIEEFELRSNQIQKSGFIKDRWEELCEEQAETLLLRGVLGRRNRLFLKLNRCLLNDYFTKRYLKNTYKRKLLCNFLRCESIRESIISLLGDDI